MTLCAGEHAATVLPLARPFVLSEVTEAFHHRQNSTSRGTINRSVHRDGLLLLPFASRLRLRSNRVSEPRRAPTLHCTQGGGSISRLPPPTGKSMVREPATAVVDSNHHGCLSAAALPSKYPQSTPLTESQSGSYSVHGLSSRRACEAEGSFTRAVSAPRRTGFSRWVAFLDSTYGQSPAV